MILFFQKKKICRFCWHRLKIDGNGLCPACRKAYSENPAHFEPLSEDEYAFLIIFECMDHQYLIVEIHTKIKLVEVKYLKVDLSIRFNILLK